MNSSSAARVPEIEVLEEIDRVTNAPDPLVGREIEGRYRIEHKLAEGGMGAVYAARHLLLDQRVAIKILPRSAPDSAHARFEREARLTARLDSPHIVRASDFGVSPELGAYLVMELLEGVDLGTWLAREGTLEPTRVIRIVRQLASALDGAHAEGIVHRDLKPANVLVLPGDFVKIVDFGIARSFSSPARLTEVGTTLGTPAYMAPEQVIGDPDALGPATDRYALGVLAMELLTGRLPYERATVAETIEAILVQPPALPSDVGLSVAGLDGVMRRALASEPHDRWPSAVAFADALAVVLEPLGARGHADTLVRPPSSERELAQTGIVRRATATPRADSGAELDEADRLAREASLFALLLIVVSGAMGLASGWLLAS